ncbi:hypothetical protein [Streptacidiphilus sp. P02-A3a]|uniref:hypothetical protein n=1 Tax=Streptacidiphilus sp. P02-A3a TaxID=2704468 RepID=UPI0015F8D0AE|nr:hypothetical protein [Streptacidiphilus sp. P02-A3a]QMU73095.1 hypothetical protein GXP74_37505 [Streptacidiphilus sp. P02-A3a]
MSLREIRLDAWSWLNCKPVMAHPESPQARRVFPELARTWVPEQDKRRLAVYKLLTAQGNGQAGQIAEVAGDEDAAERRELDDAAKLIDAALSYLL